MLTKIMIENFKKLEKISFPLSDSVVVIGPNNSGKTTVFQALCLWEIGVTSFLNAKRKQDLEGRGYVSINRRDLLNSPISDARALWRNKKVTSKNIKHGKTIVEHIPLIIELEGEDSGRFWKCKAEFTFANAESLTCRVLSGSEFLATLFKNGNFIRFGFLQAMSGLTTEEDKLTQGSIDRKLGEGRTAEVLRNICYDILFPEISKGKDYNGEKNWKNLTTHIKKVFGAELQKPEFIKGTGLIEFQYIENGIRHDISAGGRGFLQTLLLLSYLYSHPNTILLLDEPDAHLEVIRQREVFQVINQVAKEVGSQLLIASHSEVVLEEAANSATVIALIENKALEINSDRTKKHIRRALNEIGWEKYYLARMKRHVVYLEGPSDLNMLLAFAKVLNHPVESVLREANVDYVSTNAPHLAIRNFETLIEIFPQLKGFALFDRLPNLTEYKQLKVMCWLKRELENYFAKPSILKRYAMMLAIQMNHEPTKFEQLMSEVINDNTTPARLRDLNDNWWNDEKLTDNWLDLIFPAFAEKIGVHRGYFRQDYHFLINSLKPTEVEEEIKEKLDLIYDFLK
jgi:predicted ATPase